MEGNPSIYETLSDGTGGGGGGGGGGIIPMENASLIPRPSPEKQNGGNFNSSPPCYSLRKVLFYVECRAYLAVAKSTYLYYSLMDTISVRAILQAKVGKSESLTEPCQAR